MKLEARQLAVGYGGAPVLSGVDFAVPEGKIATLIGANGSGKSTLLKTFGRLRAPLGGAALLDGRSVWAYPPAALARELAILPQLRESPAALTVGELAALGRYAHRAGRAADRAAVERALVRTRLSELRDRRLGELSGGERQRAWIAMTLAQEPKTLLLDEPTTYLDIRCQFEVIELVRDLNREMGLTVLMVLHDLDLAARCSDLILTVSGGTVTHAGTPEEILTPAILAETFGIGAEILRDAAGNLHCLVTGRVPDAPAEV